METKPFWKSKTLWFNALAALFAFADQHSASIQQMLGPDHYIYFVAFVAAGNAFLRVISVQPVALLPAPAKKEDPK